MTWQEVGAVASRTVAVLPIAAVEQHGPHLPVTTDTDLVTAIATRAEAELKELMVLCPTLPYGSSHHHLSFAGTLSIQPDLFTSVVCDLIRSLTGSGFERVILLNGHGGNIVPVKQALALLAHSSVGSAEVAMTTYWELAGRCFAGDAPMESPALSHACEYETSMMMHLDRSRVRLDRVQRAHRPPGNAYVAWEDEVPSRGVFIAKRTEFLSSNGSSGEPQLASSEKGAHLIQHAVRAFVEFVQSFAQWEPMENLRNA